VILVILAIVQDVTRTPNDQIWIARALLGSEPTSAQIGGSGSSSPPGGRVRGLPHRTTR
jgi:hypothetical protein